MSAAKSNVTVYANIVNSILKSPAHTNLNYFFQLAIAFFVSSVERKNNVPRFRYLDDDLNITKAKEGKKIQPANEHRFPRGPQNIPC
jgi:hypothetical protein